MFLAKALIWRRRLGFGRWYFLVWPPPRPEPLSPREIERGKGPSQNRAIEAAEPQITPQPSYPRGSPSFQKILFRTNLERFYLPCFLFSIITRFPSRKSNV